MLGPRFCARAFSSCGDRGPLFIAARGPLTVAASLVAEHRLQTRRLSSCGSRAQLPCGMWDLPRPGLEPVSPALAGGFSTTAPPGKPLHCFLFVLKLNTCIPFRQQCKECYYSVSLCMSFNWSLGGCLDLSTFPPFSAGTYCVSISHSIHIPSKPAAFTTIIEGISFLPLSV